MKINSKLAIGQKVFYVFGDPCREDYSIIKAEVTEIVIRKRYNDNSFYFNYCLHLIKTIKGYFPIGSAYCWQSINESCINPNDKEKPIGGFATFTDKDKCKNWLRSFE